MNEQTKEFLDELSEMVTLNWLCADSEPEEPEVEPVEG